MSGRKSEAPAPAARQDKTVGRTELPHQLVLADNLVRIMLTTTGRPQVAFLRATDPNTGRWGRTPRDCFILLR
jgi:hypothetical protein